MRKVSHRCGKQVQVWTVCAELGGVNVKIALGTGWQPLHQPGSNYKYILPIQHMLKGFENKDPPRVKKLVVHHDLPDCLCIWVHRKGRFLQQQAVVDLEIISFYCILRVGEYTAPKWWGRQPRTQQFLVNDVKFFKLSKTCGFISPRSLNASKQDLLSAVEEKLCITEQKNSFKGACVHHGALEGQIFACPVKVLARRVAHIWVHTSNGTTILCAYWDSVGRGNVTNRDMSLHMKVAAAKLGHPSRNIQLDRIDT